MNPQDLKPNVIVRGPMFPEPVKIIRVVPMGGSIKLVGQGMNTGLVHQPILSPAQLANLQGSPEQQPFDGDATKFKLGVEALRLGIAYEYDPYFSLSIARVDPLPHQLEAVYDYFLRLPRIRFLLADDPGAGKTIMAGLLIKELKVRGLVKRILIVTPANLSFQWQRELRQLPARKTASARSPALIRRSSPRAACCASGPGALFRTSPQPWYARVLAGSRSWTMTSSKPATSIASASIYRISAETKRWLWLRTWSESVLRQPKSGALDFALRKPLPARSTWVATRWFAGWTTTPHGLLPAGTS